MTKSPIEQAREFLEALQHSGLATTTKEFAALLDYAESLERVAKEYQSELAAFIAVAETHVDSEKTVKLREKLKQINAILKTGE